MRLDLRNAARGLRHTPAIPEAIILSHSLWQRAFGADEQVLGRRLKLGALELDVVGVIADVAARRGTCVSVSVNQSDSFGSSWRAPRRLVVWEWRCRYPQR